jgi:hypothetical protein
VAAASTWSAFAFIRVVTFTFALEMALEQGYVGRVWVLAAFKRKTKYIIFISYTYTHRNTTEPD